MNQWPNAPTNGIFPQSSQGHLNPASMYNNLGGGSQLDFNQFTHGLSNGGSGASTPAFPNQTFQPGSVVPAKRSHDGMSGSPVQNSQSSRSQTPNYAAGFPNQQGGSQQFPNAPNAFAHLQQSNSNNATPSPTMQNQQYRPPTQQQQRVQTASPFAQQQQQQPPSNLGSQMSPSSTQATSQPTSIPPQMAALNQQYGMNSSAGMPGISGAMAGQMSNMNTMSAQKAYQLKLMQHQAQLRNSGMIPPRPAGAQQNAMFNAQQQGANGQSNAQMNMTAQQAAQQQAQREKRQQFMRAIQNHAAQQSRQFNPNPTINGKTVDLFALFHLTVQHGGSTNVDRNAQWQTLASRMGFAQQQYPTAGDELRQLFATNIAQYERLYIAMQQQQQVQHAARQEKARRQAHEMAGFGGGPQASPTRTAQSVSQPGQYSPYQQGQQSQMQTESTPELASAQLSQNGMATPQQQVLQHRRASSVRQRDQMTPQVAGQALAVQSPPSGEKLARRSPSIKQEPDVAIVRNEEPLSTEYVPARRALTSDGGYDTNTLLGIGEQLALTRPGMPTAEEMGIIDVKALSLSLASGIHHEVRYALDALAEITYDQRYVLGLRKCEDLLDIMIDVAEELVELLSEEAAEVSDALDLASYEEVMRATRSEARTLQEVPAYGTQAYDLDRAAEKLLAIVCVWRNLSLYGLNHDALATPSVIKFLSNTIRLLGTRNMLLRTFYNTLEFYKDVVILLTNTTQDYILPSRDDALHILHFLLAFAPNPAPSYTESDGKIRFPTYAPSIHVYLSPAVDSLAKLLARQDPNRMYYKSIFTASPSSLAMSESPLDLLTRAFALCVAPLPDRSQASRGSKFSLKLVEARKPYVRQGMLAADILTSLAPGNDHDLARAWLESEDGWALALLRLTFHLALRHPHHEQQQQQQHRSTKDMPMPPHYQENIELAQRALTIIKRLVEKAGKGGVAHGAINGLVNGDTGDDEEANANFWDGTPSGHTVLGAMVSPLTDEVALELLCRLHEIATQN